MSQSTVIRDVTLFTPQGRVQGDCLIEDGEIAQLGEVTRAADVELDGAGKWLFPGAFDAHVHVRDPGLTHKEDWRTGSMAAAAGGVTCMFDMPNTRPSTTTVARLEEKKALVASKSLVNFGLFFGANPDNLDEILGAERFPALKIFMAESTGDLLVHREEDLDRIFANYTGQISAHAESEERLLARIEEYKGNTDPAIHSVIRDPEAARLGVQMAAKLANRYGRRLHILHMSTRAELEALEEGRAYAREHGTGAVITAEACPHHLFLTTDAYEEWGTYVKMNPPLRGEEDRAAMWDALRDGRVQMVATDHAPHLPSEKDLGYPGAPSGVPGVQTMLPMLLDASLRHGWCTPEQIVEWVCHAPARIYGVQGRGRLEVGCAADVVLIDPELEREVTDAEQYSKCGWTPWRGRVLKGWPVRTFVNGELVFVRDGERAEFATADPVGQLVSFGR